MKTCLRLLAIGLATIAMMTVNARAEVGISAGIQINAVTDFDAPLAAEGTWGGAWVIMGVAGIPAGWRPTGGLTATGNGYQRTRAGTGRATSRGHGPAIITGAGRWIRATAGFGCRRWSGRRPGSYGAVAAVMSDGLLAHRGECLWMWACSHLCSSGHFDERIAPGSVLFNNADDIRTTTVERAATRGPDVTEIRKATGREIKTVHLQEERSRTRVHAAIRRQNPGGSGKSRYR